MWPLENITSQGLMEEIAVIQDSIASKVSKNCRKIVSHSMIESVLSSIAYSYFLLFNFEIYPTAKIRTRPNIITPSIIIKICINYLFSAWLLEQYKGRKPAITLSLFFDTTPWTTRWISQCQLRSTFFAW